MHNIKFFGIVLLTFCIILMSDPGKLVSLESGKENNRNLVVNQKTDEIVIPLDKRFIDAASLPVVNLFLNNQGPFSFLVDTGATGNLISPLVAQQLGIKGQSELPVGSSNDIVVKAKEDKLQNIRIGKTELKDKQVYITNLPDGLPIQGLLGGGLFDQFIVKIDYANKRISLFDRQKFKYTGIGTTLPLVFLGTTKIPMIKLSLDGYNGNFLLDTGFAGGLSLNPNFVKNNRLLERYRKRVNVIVGQNIAGDVKAWNTRSEKIELGNTFINNAIISLSDAPINPNLKSRKDDGRVGNEILSQFNIIIDYQNKRAIFEKNINYGKPSIFNLIGLITKRSGQTIAIIDVIPNSNAARLGIQPGNTILAINDRSVQQLDPFQSRMLLRRPAKSIKLKVQSNKGSRDLNIELKDAI
jgi:predicted aspartyl protease